MKRLYILRHSKAGQTNKNLTADHERKLTSKGQDLAVKISDNLKENFADKLPQKIISSNAVRAKSTAEIFHKNLESDNKSANKEIDFEINPKLYVAEVEEILSVVKNISEDFDSALLVGHNPGLQNFAMDFATSGDRDKFRGLRNNYPPCSYIVFDIPVESWALIENDSGILVDYIDAKKS